MEGMCSVALRGGWGELEEARGVNDVPPPIFPIPLLCLSGVLIKANLVVKRSP